MTLHKAVGNCRIRAGLCNPDSYTALSEWNVDGSYGTVADCHEAHHDDLNALSGLEQNSPDFLQTQA